MVFPRTHSSCFQWVCFASASSGRYCSYASASVASLYENHPIRFQYPLSTQGHGGLREPVPAVIRQKQCHTHKHTLNFMFPIHLACTFLDFGRKPERSNTQPSWCGAAVLNYCTNALALKLLHENTSLSFYVFQFA